MYCLHCGHQIPENSTFCQFCGTNQSGDNRTPTGVPKSYNAGIEEINIYRISSIACSVLIALFAFFELIKLEVYFGYKNFTILDFCATIIAWTEKELIEGTWGLLVFLVVLVGLVLIVTPIIYLVQDFKTKGYDYNSGHIDTGCYMMNTIIGFLIFFIITIFCISASLKESFELIWDIEVTWSVYAILIIALLNRIVFLPQYNKKYYEKARAIKEDDAFSVKYEYAEWKKSISTLSYEELNERIHSIEYQDEYKALCKKELERRNTINPEPLTPEEEANNYGSKKARHDTSTYFEDKKKPLPTQWECRRCGNINQNYVGTCKCGNTQRENNY